MHNKKGDTSFVFHAGPAITVLVIVLVIFFVFFLVTGLTKSSALVISGAHYKDSITLINLLKTEIELGQQKLTVADAINLAVKSEENANKVSEELNKLLTKLPKPAEGTSFWYLETKKLNNIFLEAGDKAEFGKTYLEQEVNIPLDNKEIVSVKLYLSCRACTKEGIESLS